MDLTSLIDHVTELCLHCEREKQRLEGECDVLTRLLLPWPQSEQSLVVTGEGSVLDAEPTSHHAKDCRKPPSDRQHTGRSNHRTGAMDPLRNQESVSLPGESDAQPPLSVDAADSAAQADEVLLQEVLTKARRLWGQAPLSWARTHQGQSAQPRLQGRPPLPPGFQSKPKLASSNTSKVDATSGYAARIRGNVSSGISRRSMSTDVSKGRRAKSEERGGSAQVVHQPQHVAKDKRKDSDGKPNDQASDHSHSATSHANDRGKRRPFRLQSDGRSLKLPGRYCKLLAEHNLLLDQVRSQQCPSTARQRFLSHFTDGDASHQPAQGSGPAESVSLADEDRNAPRRRPQRRTVSHWWLPRNVDDSPVSADLAVDPASKLHRPTVLYNTSMELLQVVAMEQDAQIQLLKAEIEKRMSNELLPVLEKMDTEESLFTLLTRACWWLVDQDRTHLPALLTVPEN